MTMLCATTYKTVMCVSCFLVLISLATVSSNPLDVQKLPDHVHQNTDNDLPHMRTSMKLIGDAKYFLRSWFRKLVENMQQRHSQQQQQQQQQPQQQQPRWRRESEEEEKPETPDIKVNQMESNQSSFEVYEKEYLINQTLNYLKQIYYYSEYRQKIRKRPSPEPGHSHGSTKVPDLIGSPNDNNRVDSLLNGKKEEMNALSLSQLDNLFHNVRSAARNGVEDPGITSLCCPQG